jgi:hypothetical protein
LWDAIFKSIVLMGILVMLFFAFVVTVFFGAVVFFAATVFFAFTAFVFTVFLALTVFLLLAESPVFFISGTASGSDIVFMGHS